MKKYILLVFCFLSFAANAKDRVKLNKELIQDFQSINAMSTRLSIPLNQFKEVFCEKCADKEVSKESIQRVIKVLTDFNQKVTLAKDGKYEEGKDGKGTPFNENDEIKKIISDLKKLIETEPPPMPINKSLDFEDSVSIANSIIILYIKYKSNEIELSQEEKEVLKRLRIPKNGLFDMFVGLLLGVVLGGSVIYIYKNRKTDIHSKLDQMNSEISKEREISKTHESDKNENIESTNLRNDIIELKNENSKLKNENSQLIGENNRLKNAINTSFNEEPTRVIQLSVEPKTTTFYLSTPNANGSFKDGRSNTMNPSMHMYEFALIDNNTARFKIIDNPVIAQEAINAPETYLKPVCDYLGGFNSSAKSIRTMEMGVAELKGDKWELRTKAKIKLL